MSLVSILIDTNVLLDVLQARSPHDAASSEVWRLAEMGAVVGFVAAISYNNIFYVAAKRDGPTVALAAVNRVRLTFPAVVPFDTKLLDLAISMTGDDLEDALQAASAQRVGADYLVTRNVDDFATLGVNAVTPIDFLAIVLP